MTNDYKDKLLKYLTNNLASDTGTNIPSFLPIESYSSDVMTQLDAAFPNGFIQQGYFLCKGQDGVNNGFICVYGNYYKSSTQTQTNMSGYILLFDENYNLVEIITEYDSGTELGYMLTLECDEEGKAYGMDYFDNRMRFIMLNNISIKTTAQTNYYAKLRRAYNLQGDITNIGQDGYTYKIDKSPIDSRYFMYATEQNGTAYGLLLKLNVGQENEWITYTQTRSQQAPSTIYTNHLMSLKVYYRDEDINVEIYEEETEYNYTNQTYTTLVMVYGNDLGNTTLGNYQTIFADSYMFNDIKDKPLFKILEESGSVISKSYRSMDYLMLGCQYQENGEYQSVIRIMNLTNIIYNETTPSEVNPIIKTNLYHINDTIVGTSSENINYSSSLGTMNSNRIYLITGDDNVVSQTTGMSLGRNDVKIKLNIPSNMYNLYSFNNIYEDFEDGFVKKIAKIVYNSHNYNGAAYEEARALLPQQVFVYSNNKLMFARNLYNKTLNQNTTTVVGEIPNTMLNDIQLDKQTLIGYTNYPLVEHIETIEKNIFESLYVNFFNTLMIQNRNNPNNPINNLPASIRLNQSVSDICDYTDATITKYRANYRDNTKLIYGLHDCTIENGIATFRINIYIGKEIDTIELISNDESTVYQTIDARNLEVGKAYKISQDCYVE